MQKASIVNGIFNENYKIVTNEKNIYLEKNSNDKFSIYMLDIENDLEIENIYSGSVLSFDVKNKGHARYYRFRILQNKYGNIIKKYKPRNSFFESAFIETEIIDFRINEIRNQDLSLLEKINESKSFYINTINFFIMLPVEDEVNSDVSTQT